MSFINGGAATPSSLCLENKRTQVMIADDVCDGLSNKAICQIQSQDSNIISAIHSIVALFDVAFKPTQAKSFLIRSAAFSATAYTELTIFPLTW